MLYSWRAGAGWWAIKLVWYFDCVAYFTIESMGKNIGGRLTAYGKGKKQIICLRSPSYAAARSGKIQ